MDLVGDEPSRPIIIRGDIDALPIQTAIDASYRSRRDDVMHACGHDAHATMALGAAMILRRVGQTTGLPRGFAARLILQPAEET
ncbi:MAG: M20/M25/M40 family metallo-hydrolase, partial [Planctomycetota bacterium]